MTGAGSPPAAETRWTTGDGPARRMWPASDQSQVNVSPATALEGSSTTRVGVPPAMRVRTRPVCLAPPKIEKNATDWPSGEKQGP